MRKLCLLTLAAAIAACDDGVTNPADEVLTRAEAEALALVVTNDLNALPEGTVFGGEFDFPAPSGALAPAAMAQCIVVRSPNPPANSDGDPVPDSVRIVYDGCVISRPTETITLSGSIDIIDPDPTVTGHSVKRRYIDFTRSVTSLITGGTTTAVQNGVRLASASSSELQHSETDFETAFTYPDGSTASHVRTWASTFTADVAGSIAPRQSLPSGTWNLEGTSTWTRNERSRSLTVSTDPDLHYNAECTAAPKFDAGKLVMVVARGERTVTVTIEFTACGQYTVTRS